MNIDIGQHDAELQEIIKLKGLLDNPGFKAYLDRVQEFYDLKEGLIRQLTQQPLLTEGSVKLLNTHIAERNALGTLLTVREEMVDVVTSSQEDVNQEN